MKEKPQLRFYLVSFSLAIFILTALASVIAYFGWFSGFPFVLIIAYVAAFALLLAFASDLLIDKYKLGWKKLLLLTFSVMILAAIVMQSVWTIITPSWSFSVSTDKSTYRLGENVNITASLKNTGFVTHSFKSLVSNPVLIFITFDPLQLSVWWNKPSKESTAEFSIPSGQSLQRSFIWNQTNIWSQIDPTIWNQTYMPGEYEITAFIPDAQALVISPSGGDVLFISYARINVTSP